jgi:acetate CoA/acetoacetate CoA-transferase alpha subunit
MNKIIEQKKFTELLKDGMSIMVGGFMTCGTPEILIDWVLESNVKHLTIICNDAGYPNEGVGKLIRSGQVDKLVASHIGLNPEAGEKMSVGLMKVDLIPQGTLVEQIRAYGAGLGGILTPTGVHTIVEEDKKIIRINETDYLLEEALGADLALIKAHNADLLGNLTYSKTARNFNPMMATAAKITICQATHELDEIDPEIVITPHIFIDHLVIGGTLHD